MRSKLPGTRIQGPVSGLTPIINKVVAMRSLIIPFLRSKKARGTAPKQSVGVVVGSSLADFLQ